jgi:hypothetical protein
MIVRSLWLIIMVLHHGSPPVAAAGRTTVARPMIQPLIVLSWTLRIAVTTAALAANGTNRLLETARTLLDRVFQDLPRGPGAAAFVAVGDAFTPRPVPPPGAQPRAPIPEPGPEQQLRAHDQHEHPNLPRNHKTKIKKANWP